MTMVCFDVKEMRFNYRVAGIALHDHQVLLNRIEEEDHWFLPGGRVEMGEFSKEGLRREMQEELREEAHVGRLLWVVESFFGGVEEKRCHELGFYYAMNFADEALVCQAKGPFHSLEEGHTHMIFQWFSLEELEKITLYPSFLVRGLQNIPEQTMHLLEARQDK